MRTGYSVVTNRGAREDICAVQGVDGYWRAWLGSECIDLPKCIYYADLEALIEAAYHDPVWALEYKEE